MRGRLSKVSVLFLALVLALGGVGAAFSAWTDTLTISGTEQTGSVDLESDDWSVWDDEGPGEPPDYYSGDPDYTCDDGFGNMRELDKNVGWAEVTAIDTDGNGANDTLKVDLMNVYPSYYNRVTIYPRNIGSVPLKIKEAIISWDEESVTITSSHHQEIDLSGNGELDFEIAYGDGFGEQLHEDDSSGELPEISIRFHVLQDTGEGVQGQSFSFTIEIVGIQWNKY